MAEGPGPPGDLRRPGLGAMQSQGLALPQAQRTVPAGSSHHRPGGLLPTAPGSGSGVFAGWPHTSAPRDLALPRGKVPGGQGSLAAVLTLSRSTAARALTYCVTATCLADKRRAGRRGQRAAPPPAGLSPQPGPGVLAHTPGRQTRR